MSKPYLGSEFIADEEPILDLDRSYHVVRQTHHHLLLLGKLHHLVLLHLLLGRLVYRLVLLVLLSHST